MNFEQPWALLGLAAIAIPIWIHLRRRRRETLLFPATELLAKLAKRQRPRLRLLRALLLLLRIAVIAAVVIAASKPGLKAVRPGGIRAGSAIALAIALDDSFSMRLRGRDGRTVFDRAKKLALAEIDRLRPGDGAALILTGKPVRVEIGETEFDLDKVNRAIESANPTFRSGDIEKALDAALDILRESPLPQREVVLITDLSERGWQKGEPSWSDGAGIGLRVLDSGSDVGRANTSVERVDVKQSSEGVQREFEIEARIVNHGGSAARKIDAVLEIDGSEVARSSVDLPASGVAVKRFIHRFGIDGMHRGSIRIFNDSLPEDDASHFSVVVRESINALVIDGDYHLSSYRDEAFYLCRALETPVPGESPIQVAVIDVDTAAQGPLAASDIVVLAGVTALEGRLAARLVEYVENGGGLFVSLASGGGRLEALEPVLPAKLRSVRRAPTEERGFLVTTVNRNHPMFKPFGGGRSGLEGTLVWAHMLVEPEPSTERSTLIDLEGGVPLLLERKVGKGTAMLLTTTIDRDWTDLPIRPGYLPLVQRTVRYLAKRLDDRNPGRIEVGGAQRLEVSAGMQRLVVRKPDGTDIAYSARDLSGRSSIEFAGTDVPGHYKVWADVPGFGGMRELYGHEFIVSTKPSESNPARVIEQTSSAGAGRFAPVEGRLPAWPYLLAAAMFLIFVETWLGGHRLRRSHTTVA